VGAKSWRSTTIGHRRHRGYAPPSLAQAAPAGLDLDQTHYIPSYLLSLRIVLTTDPLAFSISSALIRLARRPDAAAYRGIT